MVALRGNSAWREGATLAQVAPAWLLAQQLWIVPIPGTRRLERMGKNFGAIVRAAAQMTSRGSRYPENQERLTKL